MNGRFCIGIVISFAGLSPHSFSHHPDVPATNALGSSQTETSITVEIAALEAVLSLRHQKGCTTCASSAQRSFLGASQQAGGSCRRRLTLNLDEDMTRKLVISASANQNWSYPTRGRVSFRSNRFREDSPRPVVVHR